MELRLQLYIYTQRISQAMAEDFREYRDTRVEIERAPVDEYRARFVRSIAVNGRIGILSQ